MPNQHQNNDLELIHTLPQFYNFKSIFVYCCRYLNSVFAKYVSVLFFSPLSSLISKTQRSWPYIFQTHIMQINGYLQRMHAAESELCGLEKNGIHMQAAGALRRLDELDAQLGSVEEGLASIVQGGGAPSDSSRASKALQDVAMMRKTVVGTRRRVQENNEKKLSAQREELLGRNAAAAASSSSSASHSPVGGGGAHDPNAQHHKDTLLRKEQQSLIHSTRKLRQLVGESDAILGALKTQGNTLDGTRSKLSVDFLEAIGLSRQTALQVVRRGHFDALLVYGGILLMVLLMGYIWWWR